MPGYPKTAPLDAPGISSLTCWPAAAASSKVPRKKPGFNLVMWLKQWKTMVNNGLIMVING
jgi:hypothetical protein